MTRQHVIRRPHHPHRVARQHRPPQRRHWSWRHTHSHPGQSGRTSPNGLAHAPSPSPSSRRGSRRGSPRRQRHALLPHAPWHPKQRIRAGLRPSPSIWRACLHSPCWHAAILSEHTTIQPHGQSACLRQRHADAYRQSVHPYSGVPADRSPSSGGWRRWRSRCSVSFLSDRRSFSPA